MSFIQEYKILRIASKLNVSLITLSSKQSIKYIRILWWGSIRLAPTMTSICYIRMSVHTTCHNKNIVFHFRFDFTVVVTTFIVQLFEIDIPFLTFMIPFRFLRSVYNICTYICLTMYRVCIRTYIYSYICMYHMYH